MLKTKENPLASEPLPHVERNQLKSILPTQANIAAFYQGAMWLRDLILKEPISDSHKLDFLRREKLMHRLALMEAEEYAGRRKKNE